MKKNIALALFYLPVLFFAWYFFSPLIAFLVSVVIEPVATWLTGGTINSLQYQDVLVQGNIVLQAGTYGELVVPAQQTAEVSITARPMVYGYSIPLLLTLLLAFPGRALSGLMKASLLALLLLGICAGTLMELIKIVYFDLDPALISGGKPDEIMQTVIAICYQLTTLILPAVLPIGCWLALNGQQYLAKYVPAASSGD